MAETVALVPVDGVEVTVVMDNSIDILAASTEAATRPAWRWDWSEGDQLRAEHGYSLAVTVHRNGGSDTILYDAGLTRDSTVHNLDVLGIDPKDLRAVVLSHGHADHLGGLGVCTTVWVQGPCRSCSIRMRRASARSCFPMAKRYGCRHPVIRTWIARDGRLSRRSVRRCSLTNLCS